MTMRYLLTIALAVISCSLAAQELSLQPSGTELVVKANGLTAMTALQFNLKLPEGVNVNTDNATLGSATDGHTLCIETLDCGDLLFIIYSMDLNTFTDGELLRLPINGVQDGDASLYTIRYANSDAVSHSAEDIVTKSPLLTSPKPKGEGLIYNVSGQRLSKMQNGINIVDGKKIISK